MKNVAS